MNRKKWYIILLSPVLLFNALGYLLPVQITGSRERGFTLFFICLSLVFVAPVVFLIFTGERKKADGEVALGKYVLNNFLVFLLLGLTIANAFRLEYVYTGRRSCEMALYSVQSTCIITAVTPIYTGKYARVSSTLLNIEFVFRGKRYYGKRYLPGDFSASYKPGDSTYVTHSSRYPWVLDE